MITVKIFAGMFAPELKPAKPDPSPGKAPKPKSGAPILLRLAPRWRLPPRKSLKGSSAEE